MNHFKSLLKRSCIIFFLSVASIVQAQPARTTVQADIKKEMGANCSRVDVTGNGTTAREFVNNVWVTYYRIPVHATLTTEMAGVTRLLKGSAWYDVNGSRYTFKKYNPGTAEYLGIPAPNLTEIKAFIESLGDYGLGGKANVITEVHQFDLLNTPVTWHTLYSVSIPADLTYTIRKSNTQLEKIKEPFEMRLYQDATSKKWVSVAWLTPNAATDSRKKTSLGIQTVSTTQMSQTKTLFEKKMSQQATEQFNQLPDVVIPAFSTTREAAIWMNSILQEGNSQKSEKVFLTLLHPSQRNSAGILSNYASDLLNKLKTATQNDFSGYKDQYCPNLMIKEQGSQTIEWWNKDRTKFSRMAVQVESGKWYLTDLSINVWRSFEANAARKTSGTTCQ